jgi:hypothetical protein
MKNTPHKSRLLSYWWSLPAGIALTAVISYSLTFLEGTPLRYINLMINDRGPVQYLVLASGLSVFIAGVQAFARADIRSKLAVLLVVLAFLPLFFGISGFLLGKASMDAMYAKAMAGNPTAEEIIEIESCRSMYFGSIYDVILLAVIVGVPTFILAMNLLIACAPEPRRLPPPEKASEVRFAKAWFLQALGSQAIGLVLGFLVVLISVSLLTPLIGKASVLPALLLAIGIHIIVSYMFFKWAVSRYILRQVMESDPEQPAYKPKAGGAVTLILIGMALFSPFIMVLFGHPPSIWTGFTAVMSDFNSDIAVKWLRILSPMVILLALGCMWEGCSRLKRV